MKVIVDDKIPFIRESIEAIADEVCYLPAQEINANHVKDADALIIRTRTKCNKTLLQDSHVKFIATATIGYDHIDASYCKSAGITWQNTPGCNASSVAQYIESSLLLLQEDFKLDLSKQTLGIVGYGHIGKKVYEIAQHYKMNVLVCDPPLKAIANTNNKNFFSSLEQLQKESTIITFHVPLVHEGPNPTYHLADSAFFSQLQKKPFIINTSRGEVIATKALQEAMNYQQIKQAIIDVWENEPQINTQLLQQVYIGTPHIAGYSADGKANASAMALKALCDFFNIIYPIQITPPQPAETIIRSSSVDEALLKIYNPKNDSIKLKTTPEKFEFFRGNYPLRREKEAYTLILE